VGGNSRITPRQPDWLVGYRTAAGDSAEVIEAVMAYDDADRLGDIMSLPKMAFTRRSISLADDIGIARDEVVALQQVVAEEHALQRRRYELIVVPVLPFT
jgi:hypothetical protein